MQKNNPLPPDLTADQILPVLSAVEKALAKHRQGKEAHMALLRPVPGMTMESWGKLAERGGLDGWLALPLEEDARKSVCALLNAIETIAFQRDHDPLTGLANRRRFDARLTLEVERANRMSYDLSLITLDLDHFKRVNDTYGHPFGDVVLRAMGQLLQSSVRAYDLPARVGGEEFSILLPSASITAAQISATNILRKFSKIPFSCKGETFTLSFSAGISSVKLLGGQPTEQMLVESADKALYQAKEKGRNRIVLAEGASKAKPDASLVQSDEKLFLFSGVLPQ
jgi:diguanylate cyclase (GGDEF) domain